MVADCQKVMCVRAVLNKSPDFLGSNFFNIRMPTKSLGALPVNITLNLNCCAEMCVIVGLGLFVCCVLVGVFLGWLFFFFNY